MIVENRGARLSAVDHEISSAVESAAFTEITMCRHPPMNWLC